MSGSKVTFVPTPESMRLLWSALGDAAKNIETNIAIISVDPGVNCAFAVQTFAHIHETEEYGGDYLQDKGNYKATAWAIKAPMRTLKNGKRRSYLDAKALAKSMDKAFEVALKNTRGPTNIMVVIEDNGGPIARGIQAAWTMAECIGCLKSCAVNTASLLSLAGPEFARVDEVVEVFVPPVEWVREFGLYGSSKMDRVLLLHKMLYGKPPSVLPKELRMNDHKTDAMLVGMYAGLRRYYKNWAGLLAAVAKSQESANAD